ncbi:MAG TPA: carbonic anhydrase [Methylomirabilota bacterium]|nr:carbonic anhydrase [Methylomirabilota bacterium]
MNARRRGSGGEKRGLALCLAWVPCLALAAAEPSQGGDPALKLLRDASLMLLREGNQRFVAGKSQHPNLDAERRTNTVAHGQEPFATILACSDSRDPVELLFDRGVGDLFVVRVAGNIVGLSELASIEYGVGHLGTPLLVVMGHTRCGAVTAVVKGADLHGHLPRLADHIKPAAERALAITNQPDAAVPHAVQENVWQSIADIFTKSSLIRERAKAGKVHVEGAIYDLETGRVNWLGPHPEAASLHALPLEDPAHGEIADVPPPDEHAHEPPKTPPRSQGPADRPPMNTETVLRALSKSEGEAEARH